MVENAKNDYRTLATAYIERGCGDAKGLRKLTEEIIGAAEWADFTELRIASLPTDKQQAVTERLNCVLQAALDKQTKPEAARKP